MGWRLGRMGGWVGPVFWPFLLGDILSYVLWPYDYYYPFWSYGTFPGYYYGGYAPATTIAIDMATALVAYRTSTGTTEADIAATPAERATKKP